MIRSNIARVLVWMTGALVAFSAMAVSVRELAGTLSIFEILAVRTAAGVAILLAVAAARPDLRPRLATRRLGLHALRNVVHFAGQYGWALSLTHLLHFKGTTTS